MKVTSNKRRSAEIRVAEAKIKFLQQKLRNLKEDYDDDYSMWDYISGDVEAGRVDVTPKFVRDAVPNRFTPPCDPNYNRLVFDTPVGELVVRAPGFFEDAEAEGYYVDDSTATLDGKRINYIDFVDDYVVFANNKYLLLFSVESDGGSNRIGAFLYRISAVPEDILSCFGL